MCQKVLVKCSNSSVPLTMYKGTSRMHLESHVCMGLRQTSNPRLPFLPFCKPVNEDFTEAWIETCVLRIMSDTAWHMSHPVRVKDEKWATSEGTLQGDRMTSNQNGRSGKGCSLRTSTPMTTRGQGISRSTIWSVPGSFTY